MRPQHEDYLRLAAAARVEAANVALDNVRQKLLLSAATWEGLAHSASKVAESRAKRLIEGTAGSPEIAL